MFLKKNNQLFFYFILLILNLNQAFGNQSVLSNGQWFKLSYNQTGVYKLTTKDLNLLGIENPNFVRIFNNGGDMLSLNPKSPYFSDLTEIPLKISEDGSVLFYLKGVKNWKYNYKDKYFQHQENKFSDDSWIFVTTGTPKTIPITNYSSTNPVEINSYFHCQYYEKDEINLIKSGRNWYGEKIYPNSPLKQAFKFENVVEEKSTIYFKSAVLANNNCNIEVSINGLLVATAPVKNVYYSHDGQIADLAGTFASFIPKSDEMNLQLSIPCLSGAFNEANIDYIGLNVKCSLRYIGLPIIIRESFSETNGSDAVFKISGATNDLTIWDVTDIHNIKEINYSIDGEIIQFYTPTSQLKEYIIFDPNQENLVPNLNSKTNLPNQDLNSFPNCELLIISPDEANFLKQAERLAKIRRDQDSLSVGIVTTNQIYNQYSSGMVDIAAIRNFTRDCYYQSQGSNRALRYLLLFGDGTYDNRFNLPNNRRLIPTYQSEESLHHSESYVSDDFYGWFDDSISDEFSKLEIAVGRFPIKDSIEARIIVEKYIQYSKKESFGDWRNLFCFVADDEDYNTHMDQADSLARIIEKKKPEIVVKKIYFDSYSQVVQAGGQRYPEVNSVLNATVNQGALVINYTGHGSEKQLAHELIVDKSSIASWKNTPRYPVFITATCEFSRFDDVGIDVRGKSYSDRTTAGEYIFLNPKGGGIALLTTSRLVYSSSNHTLNVALYKYFFEKDPVRNERYRLGDVFRLAKNSMNGINKLNFTLLGDPSLMVALPDYKKIQLDSINGYHSNEFKDTLKAMGNYYISASVLNDSGAIDSSFQGRAQITIFDKSTIKNTLNNDNTETGTFKYSDLSSVLFRGQATVYQGKFKLNFILPKDMDYRYGNGKMVFYAYNNQFDGHGYYSQFINGGTSGNINDITGPGIKIYMNDTNFRSGGITNDSPLLIVKLSDKQGINISDRGVGHDITATIDDNLLNQIILNQNYITEPDVYDQGTAFYRFNSLKSGLHKIEVKAHDGLNNPAKTSIYFNVVEISNVKVASIQNYPNPFRDYTNFSLIHNQGEENLEIVIEIYGFTGNLVKTIKKTGYFNGFQSIIHTWDGTGNNGQKLASGIYPYRVKIKSSNGSSNYISGKCMIH